MAKATFFDHVRNSGLVEIKKLKRLVDSLRVRKRIKCTPVADYRERVVILQKVEGYERLPALERYVARELLRLGWLNVWQISQLIEGRRRFTLGEYRIRDSLGQGGYAHVFLAESGQTSELVAIKVFQSSRSQPEVLNRFLREAMLQESIIHKNIVRLIDCGQDGNVDYLVFEYMPGGDVRKLIRDELQLPILQSVKIISQASEALYYLHRQGIVHRDVKPANILLTDSGEAKLGDLGLCGFLDNKGNHDPRFGKLVGTADYMAPDHILKPQHASPQWDIYSLGCTFYQMVTGIVPFPKIDSREKIMAHLRSKLVDPRVFRNDLPLELAEILIKMMAKDPAKRFREISEVLVALKRWHDGQAIDVSAHTGGAHEPEHVTVGVETLQKLREYSASAESVHGTAPDVDLRLRKQPALVVSESLLSEQEACDLIITSSDDVLPDSAPTDLAASGFSVDENGFRVDAIDLAAVNDVPLEKEIYEIYELQKPHETGQGDFSFELPVEQIDDELPMQFDQKSLFDFVTTFEQETKIPRWKADTLSKLRRCLPLALRLRFAKREVVMRRFARQMRGGYVLDPKCGGERAHVKAEPTFGWLVWWFLSVKPYDAYGFFPSPRISGGASNDTPNITPNHAEEAGEAEYLRVRLPGRSGSVLIEVPPVITEWGGSSSSDQTQTNDDSTGCNNQSLEAPTNEFQGKRAARPFEPLAILFWFLTVSGFVAVGMFALWWFGLSV